jgi:flavin reductase (DIM6/NTAB) family NADH-FMN oxidoreductase RutF
MNKISVKNYPMVNPTPVVILGAEVEGKPNFTTIGAFGVVCLEPIFYISVKSTHHITKGIKESGFFSINLPSANMVQKTDYCGMVSGKSVDKASLFTTFYDEHGNAPLIKEAPMNYLCKVVQNTTICGFDVFFGEILSTLTGEDYLTENKPDPLKIDPLLLMGYQYYSLGSAVGGIFKEGLSLKNNQPTSINDEINPHLNS